MTLTLPRGATAGGRFRWATGNARTAIGVDLGQRHDFTAVAVVERLRVKTGFDAANWTDTFADQTAVRHLERLPLGTPYTEVVERIRAVADELWDTPPMTVVVDATGVGAPVVDLLQRSGIRCPVAPVLLTSGDAARQEGNYWKVPKRDIVTRLQVMLEQRELRIAAAIPEAATFVKELQAMRVKTGLSGREQTGAWREGEHDDLVLAVGLACWWLERHRGAIERERRWA